MAQQQQSSHPAYVHHAPKKVFIQKMRQMHEEEEEKQRGREGGASPNSSSGKLSPGSSIKDSPTVSPRLSPHGSPSIRDLEDLPSIPSMSSVLSPSDFDFTQLQSPALFDENKPIDLSSPGSGKHRGSKDFAGEGVDALSPGSHSSSSQRSSPGSPTLRGERNSPPAKRGAGGGKNLDYFNSEMGCKPFEYKKPRLDPDSRHGVTGSGAHSGRKSAPKSSSPDDIEGLQRQMQTLYNQMPVSTLAPHSMVPHGIPPLLVTAAITSHVNSALGQTGAGVGFRPYLPDVSLLQAAPRGSVLPQTHFPTPSTEAQLMAAQMPDTLNGKLGLSSAERMALLSQPMHSMVAERLNQMFGNKESAEQAYLNSIARRTSSEVVGSSDQLGERQHSTSSTGSNSPTSTFNVEPRGKLYRDGDYHGDYRHGQHHQHQQAIPPVSRHMVYHVTEEGGISSTCGPDGRSMHIKKERDADHRTLDNILDQKLQPLPLPSDSTKSDEQHFCQVCGDVAAGFHCGAYVCEACKKFFVRCLKQDGGIKFVCPRNKVCQITKDTRTQCQFCRYQKCVDIGMYRPGGANISSEISNIPCKVCGAPSSGYHFGAITCEGCKGFFRRTVKERDSMKYQCSRSGSCIITTATRNICKFCRYQKCLDVGMKPDGSRIGRQPNSVKHATMLELQHIKHNKDFKVEVKTEPYDPVDSDHSGPNSPEGATAVAAAAAVASSHRMMTSAYESQHPSMPHLPQELPAHYSHQSMAATSSQQRVLPPSPPLLSRVPLEISHSHSHSHNVRPPPPFQHQHESLQSYSARPPLHPVNPHAHAADLANLNMNISSGQQISARSSLSSLSSEEQVMGHSLPSAGGLHSSRSLARPDLQHQYHSVDSDSMSVSGMSSRLQSRSSTTSSCPDTPTEAPSQLRHSSEPSFSHQRHHQQQQQQQSQHEAAFNPPSRSPPRMAPTQRESSRERDSNASRRHSTSMSGQSPAAASASTSAPSSASTSTASSPRGTSSSSTGSPKISAEELNNIIAAMESTRKDLRNMRKRCPQLPEHISNEASIKEAWHWMMVQFQQCAHAAVKFAKKIPGFRKREIQEQIQLIQSCMFPIVMAILGYDYCLESKKYNYFCLAPEEEALVMKRFPPFTSLIPTFHSIGQTIKNLNMDETEVAFLCAMTLTTEASNHEGQEQLVAALQEYCRRKDGEDASRAALILLRLCELSRANMAHQTAVIQIQTQKETYGELEMPQLFQETFLND